MATGVAWLCAERQTKRRVFDVLGTDPALRADVCARIEEMIAPTEVLRFDAAACDGREVWTALARAPLPTRGATAARLVVVSHAEELRDFSGLERFIADRASFAESVLLLESNREQVGRYVFDRERSRLPRVPGSSPWVLELESWEQRLKEFTGAASIVCSPPSVEVLATHSRGALSPAARWLSLRLQVTQRQAEYVWARSGDSPMLARDLVTSLAAATRWVDARSVPWSDFTARVDVVSSAHGAEDVAELLLFGRRDAALAALAEHEFSSAAWAKILGYLSQRLDWLGPLHDALRTREDLNIVENRLGIQSKWILKYAHRDFASNNIARHYDRSRVARNRVLLSDLSEALESAPGVPAGLGEVLVCSW